MASSRAFSTLSALHAVRTEAEHVIRCAGEQLEKRSGTAEAEASANAHVRLLAAHQEYEAVVWERGGGAELLEVHPARGDALLDATRRAWIDQIAAIWPELRSSGIPTALNAVGNMNATGALASATRGVPEWLLTRAKAPLRLYVRPSLTAGGGSLLHVGIDGAFAAVIQLGIVTTDCASECGPPLHPTHTHPLHRGLPPPAASALLVDLWHFRGPFHPSRLVGGRAASVTATRLAFHPFTCPSSKEGLLLSVLPPELLPYSPQPPLNDLCCGFAPDVYQSG